MKFWEYQIRAEADYYKVFRVKDMMTDYDTSVLRRLEIVCLCLLRISNLVAPFCSPFFNSLITQFMRKMSHHLMSRLLKWTGHAFKKVKIYSNFTQSMSIHPSIHQSSAASAFPSFSTCSWRAWRGCETEHTLDRSGPVCRWSFELIHNHFGNWDWFKIWLQFHGQTLWVQLHLLVSSTTSKNSCLSFCSP